MSEWWTYSIRDLLLFSRRTYFRLFELYYQDVWPAQVLAVTAGVLVLALLLMTPSRRRGVFLFVVLSASWAWVGWAFLQSRYAVINWAATGFAAAFAVEALLLATLAWPVASRPRAATTRFGQALFAFALLLHPVAGLLLGREWTQMECFGLTPDATAMATLGALLLVRGKRVGIALVIPLLWLVITSATLWAIGSHEWWITGAAGLMTLFFLLFRRRRRSERGATVSGVPSRAGVRRESS